MLIYQVLETLGIRAGLGFGVWQSPEQKDHPKAFLRRSGSPPGGTSEIGGRDSFR